MPSPGRRLETSRVLEDEHVVALTDHQPVDPGHVLVAPRRYAAGLEDLEADWRARERAEPDVAAAQVRGSPAALAGRPGPAGDGSDTGDPSVRGPRGDTSGAVLGGRRARPPSP
ncbi:HIT domain-containing protein [Kineococcus sp. SYSU DK003]|uniref:HIT domain-containing protein n=1 Tax=Kineococcus sp. SYSU DK003 TaxID=3383124 RepID=UPI003D7E2E49